MLTGMAAGILACITGLIAIVKQKERSYLVIVATAIGTLCAYGLWKRTSLWIGSTLYLSLASIFVAQAAGVELSFGQQMIMCFTLMLTSKGVAGVPRAALVVLTALHMLRVFFAG